MSTHSFANECKRVFGWESRLREMIGILVVLILPIRWMESAKLNLTRSPTTTTRATTTEEARMRATIESLRPDRGQYDDTARTVYDIETLRMLPLIGIPKLKNMTGKVTNDSVADAEFVQYISEVQAVVVALRQSYLDILRGHAEWTARWYEVHFPDYYACVTRNLIRLMRGSMIEYPKKVIMKIRTVKDAILRSYITKVPISKVDPEVFDGLSDLIGSMEEVLRDHREGKGDKVDGMEYLLETHVRFHEEEVRTRCKIPLTDGQHTSRDEQRLDENYSSDEDYEPIDYFRISS